ncbi:MAG: oligosaccharide flippase family protein [Gemmatimonadetes bacterium]|nr:oligosaccharide flippase family protein [Gemmatimonadota bacterium]
MSPVKRNILANFAGNGWSALMGLAFVPLYIYFMGIEAYGLVGVFATLQVLMALLDMGLSSTLNREMARLSVRENAAQEMRDLLRTLEVVFWPTAVLIGIGLLLLAPFIANDWLQSNALPAATMQQAIVLMGLGMALHWPSGFYSGGLLGLQRHVLLNGIVIFTTTVRNVGAVLILWLVSPTITAFFSWQIAGFALQTALVALFLWRSLPAAGARARFQTEIIRGIWRFAAGISGITVLAVILTQLDKIILSRLLTLEMFGYYTLAGVVSMSLYRLISPMFAALYPRFSELVARGDISALRTLYHRSCQLLSVLLLPVALVIALFSGELLLLWTQNETTVRHTSLVLSLLVIGAALNGLMHLPYALQLAHGWTKLALYTNAVAVAVLVPLIFFAASRYGAVGAAAVWVLLNSSYVLVSLQIMHTRLLPGDRWRWYLEDVGLPLVAALSVTALGRWLLPAGMTMIGIFFWVAVTAVLALVAAALSAPQVRRSVFERIGKSTLQFGF